MSDTLFQPWLDRWGLSPDGEAFSTPYTRSWLMPVRRGREPAMLKLAYEVEEQRGGGLMAWWAGEGAARVLAHHGEALLLERAMGRGDLVEMAGTDDDGATAILCRAAMALHAPRATVPPATLVPLATWFAALGPGAARHGGVLAKAHATSELLLADPREVSVLHGDLHHENVLDFGPRGWLAIDPKGLVGERGFDYANIFCNPDPLVAAPPERMRRQVEVVAESAGLERRRLLQWILAYAGLSASWTLEDANDRDEMVAALTTAEIAAAELGF
ncbi:aminoglycoside phosphotransferase family protein [Phenylobacterium sp.]|uniref:aminoglycoside phosphotransferase family protein n=1 Tax=Phenylobacterium sp. TaxID=1871053 RepID=UPI00286CCFBF|nr:aminoglycoside phosphotransferase family protein [Phenylobacterium sp.]